LLKLHSTSWKEFPDRLISFYILLPMSIGHRPRQKPEGFYSFFFFFLFSDKLHYHLRRLSPIVPDSKHYYTAVHIISNSYCTALVYIYLFFAALLRRYV